MARLAVGTDSVPPYDRSLHPSIFSPNLTGFLITSCPSPPQVVRQNDARPLPAFIRERIAAIEIGTRSGLFTEIHRAWVTADDEVFLWNYDDRDEEDVA